jgi:transcriptional regulator with XRE-family HTH domain
MTSQEEPDWRRQADADRDLLPLLQREHAEQMSEIERQSAQDSAEHASEMRRILIDHERVLCQKVAQLREERGWSQAELARRLSAIGFEMHQTTVAKLEAGKRPLRVAEAFALAQVFALPPLAMFSEPVKDDDYGMDYMRDRLKSIDERLETMTETYMRTLEAFAKNYAEISANRLIVADNMRRAAARQAKGDDDGEHQEKT